ncbi:uncharacterized protein LOC128470961 [Spea bombifrons]|uniref:uncharacterized protein LOC128470961 n=1 Tax=Spea bombifrons TaxID=233779 RepID=UPI00234B6443|nr:uncharacterized protein LOC128470961 [Spea bombifrons]
MRGYFILLCALSLDTYHAVEGVTPDASQMTPISNTHPVTTPQLAVSKHQDTTHPGVQVTHNVLGGTHVSNTQPVTKPQQALSSNQDTTHPGVPDVTHNILGGTHISNTHPVTTPQLALSKHQDTTHPGVQVTHNVLGGTHVSNTLPVTKPQQALSSNQDPTHPVVERVTHNTLEQTHFSSTHPTTKPQKALSSNQDALSKPNITLKSLHNKALQISCFSKSGVLPIHYSIFQNGLLLKNVTVHTREPANFIIKMVPVDTAVHKCTAESGADVKHSDELTVRSSPEEAESTMPSEKDRTEDNEGPKHIIALNHILTSVKPQVQHLNTILLSVCGPIILMVLGMFIIVNHFCE